MITYEWTIPTTDFTTTADGSPDRVTTIHWRCTATEGEASASTYGTVGVDLPATITEAEAIQAAKDANPDVEGSLASQLDRQAQPETGTGRVWDIPASAKVWRADVAYAVDDVALYQGTPWTCIQAHTSQRGWTPPAVPALWSIQNQGGDGPVEWVAGESVAVGDQRVYQGTTYEVIQAHTTQAGWEPPNVPALWTEV